VTAFAILIVQHPRVRARVYYVLLQWVQRNAPRVLRYSNVCAFPCQRGNC
jgi:hypothetical protein